MCGLKSLQRHSRTVSTPLIGISLSRLPATHNDSTDLQEYSDTAFITNYIEDVTELKTITVWTNQKPWLTEEVKCTGSCRLGTLPSQQEKWRAREQLGPTCLAAAGRQRGSTPRRFPPASTTAETHGACGRGYRSDYKPPRGPVIAPSLC